MYNVCTNILSHWRGEPLQPIEAGEASQKSHLATVSPGFRRLQHSDDAIQFVYALRRFLQQVEVIQNTIELHSARGKLNGSFIGL